MLNNAYPDLSNPQVISCILGTVQYTQGSLQSLLNPHLRQMSLQCISIISSPHCSHVSVPDKKSLSLLLSLPVPQLDTLRIGYSPTNAVMLALYPSTRGE